MLTHESMMCSGDVSVVGRGLGLTQMDSMFASNYRARQILLILVVTSQRSGLVAWGDLPGLFVMTW